jgi:hypothetical protein
MPMTSPDMLNMTLPESPVLMVAWVWRSSARDIARGGVDIPEDLANGLGSGEHRELEQCEPDDEWGKAAREGPL